MKKSWIKSKTFWASLLGMLGSIGAYLLGTIELSQLLVQAGAFLGMFGIRDAIK